MKHFRTKAWHSNVYCLFVSPSVTVSVDCLCANGTNVNDFLRTHVIFEYIVYCIITIEIYRTCHYHTISTVTIRLIREQSNKIESSRFIALLHKQQDHCCQTIPSRATPSFPLSRKCMQLFWGETTSTMIVKWINRTIRFVYELIYIVYIGAQTRKKNGDESVRNMPIVFVIHVGTAVGKSSDDLTMQTIWKWKHVKLNASTTKATQRTSPPDTPPIHWERRKRWTFSNSAQVFFCFFFVD